MKKTLSFCYLFVVFLVLLSFSQSMSFADDTSVKVTTPTFPVRLNGFYTGDDEFFPIIVYKDISYIPLTQDMAERLNLRVWWDDNTKSISIKKHPVRNDFSFGSFGAPSRQIAQRHSATIPQYTIYVNDKKLDMKKEPYPVLNLNNITYFPLTWRFAVKEFGWKYDFSAQDGLQIFSLNYNPSLLPNDKVYGDSGTPKHHSFTALKEKPEDKALKMPLIAFKEPFIYQDGHVYSFHRQENLIQFWRKSLHGSVEIIGSANIAVKNMEGYHQAIAYPNDTILFTSHFGGATMGSDKHYLLSENKAAKLLSEKRFSFLQSYDKGFVGALFGVTGPQSGLVKIDFNGTEQSFGNKNSYYQKGIAREDTLYVLVSESDINKENHSSLYAIDIKNGKHTKLLDKVFDFIVDEHQIYFRQERDKQIYSYPLSGGNPKKVVPLFDLAQEYFSTGEKLFSTVRLPQSGNKEIFNLYREENGKWEFLAKEIRKPLFSESHLVYLTSSEKGQFVVIADEIGKMTHSIPVGVKEVDYFLDDEELIVWSWQDQTVRYYNLNK